MKRKFTIENIRYFLKECLNIEWIGNLIYCTQENHYRKAKLSDFGKMPAQLLLNMPNKNNNYVVLVEVTDNSFILEFCGNKLNATEDWNDYILNSEIVKTTLRN